MLPLNCIFEDNNEDVTKYLLLKKKKRQGCWLRTTELHEKYQRTGEPEGPVCKENK